MPLFLLQLINHVEVKPLIQAIPNAIPEHAIAPLFNSIATDSVFGSYRFANEQGEFTGCAVRKKDNGNDRIDLKKIIRAGVQFAVGKFKPIGTGYAVRDVIVSKYHSLWTGSLA